MLAITDIPEIPLWKSQAQGNSDNWFFQQLSRFAGERSATSRNKTYSGAVPLVSPGVSDILTVEGEPYAYFIIQDGSLSTGSYESVYYLQSWNAFMSLTFNSSGPTFVSTALNYTKTDFNTNNNVTNNGDGTYNIYLTIPGTTGNPYYVLFTKG